MKHTASIAAALIAILAEARAEPPLTPQEQAIFADLLSLEFSSVCVRTEAYQQGVEEAAELRDWKPRPVEISGYAAKAWDGAVEHLTYARGVSRKQSPFIAAVDGQNSPRGRECLLLTKDVAFAALAAALKNQGFELVGEADWSDQLGYEHRYAQFCSPSLFADGKKHDIILGWRELPKRPLLSGVRIIHVRDSSLSRTICPQTISVGSTGPNADPPRIEPWLGEKPDRPPSPVDEEP